MKEDLRKNICSYWSLFSPYNAGNTKHNYLRKYVIDPINKVNLVPNRLTIAVERKLPKANTKYKQDIEYKPRLLNPSSLIAFEVKLSAELKAMKSKRNPKERIVTLSKFL